MSDNTNDYLISFINNPTMPIPWDSTSLGASYECGNYLCILQKMPHCLYENEDFAKIFPPNVIALQTVMNQKAEFKYLYALFCYWKKGANPSGQDSKRPALIYTIEVSIFSPAPLLCCFTPSGRINNGQLNGPLTEENVVLEFFKHLTHGHVEHVKKIGDISVGYELQTGHKLNLPRKTSGCLGAFLSLFMFLGALGYLIIWSLSIF